MASPEPAVTVAALQQMKRDGRKIVGVVAWDYQIAQLVERAGVDIVSVGDSAGMNLWGQPSEGEVTLEEMLVLCRAVRRGVMRALVNCDIPSSALDHAVEAAVRLKEAGADTVKLEGGADAVRAIVRAGVPVFAQISGAGAAANPVEQAKRLEQAGAALLDFRHSGPVAGPAVVRAVSIPVIGGLGGGPWLDGRMRMVHSAIGYAASNVDAKTENYANVARTVLDAIRAYTDDVRAGRQLKGQRPA